MQQQSNVLVSTRMGICRDGGLEEGFKMWVVGMWEWSESVLFTSNTSTKLIDMFVDGWVYTNNAWLGPRPIPYTSRGGSVTRRRRWVRRVWFDEERYQRDSWRAGCGLQPFFWCTHSVIFAFEFWYIVLQRFFFSSFARGAKSGTNAKSWAKCPVSWPNLA